jgi:glycosyltransferase involved in cell wall biosynthesis
MSCVYYIGSGISGCYNVRCLLPLVANGWDGDYTSINSLARTPENKTRAIQDAQIVVFHRPEDTGRFEMMKLLRENGKKIVYDNDDTYKDPGAVKINDYFTQELVNRGMDSIGKRTDAAIIEADLVTTTTEFLADEYRRLNNNVRVLPNCVDPFLFDEPIRNETDVVRIGVTGSIGVSSDIDVLAPIVRHYENDPRVKIVFFSLPPNRKENPLLNEVYRDEYRFLDSVNVEWHPTVNADKYYDKLNSLKLDIMIIPRKDNYFNRCKSNLKFLESSMFEIPCIAQGFADEKSPYQANPNDQNYMKIVIDNNDWITTIEEMIADKEGRQEMGKKAREYVEDVYSIDNNYKKWYDAYETLLK